MSSLDKALKEIMRHAVAGHSTGEYSSGYHTYCSDVEHAHKILADAKAMVVSAETEDREEKKSLRFEAFA